jgi:hypothetical protein
MTLGNHEVMNLTGDLRYLSRGEIAAFAADEVEEDRERGFELFVASREAVGLTPQQARAQFDESYPPGWFAHRKAFSADGKYGKWLLERPAVGRFNDTVFVHGGLDPADAEKGMERINREMRSELLAFFDMRAKLIDAGWIQPLDSFSAGFTAVSDRLQHSTADDSSTAPVVNLARKYAALRGAIFIRSGGPVWNRELAVGDESELQGQVEAMLATLGARRIVVGHTSNAERRIRPRFEGFVFPIDTSGGAPGRGVPSALEIDANGEVVAVYPMERETLAAEIFDDAAVERFLLEAEILSVEDLGTGVTRPKKLMLRRDGRELKAAFKDINVDGTASVTRLANGVQLNFTDRYHYERAAYIIDRMLGLNMAPVAVIREVEGSVGVVVDWVEDAVNEADRANGNLVPDDPSTLLRQQDMMRVFDELIGNEDRHPGNQLITTADWKLHLIDHSRAFRVSAKLSPESKKRPFKLPRRLYNALAKLDRQAVREQTEGLLTRVQVSAMFKRRDRILARIDDRRDKYGNASVFHAE